jgi:hypothetical protein
MALGFEDSLQKPKTDTSYKPSENSDSLDDVSIAAFAAGTSGGQEGEGSSLRELLRKHIEGLRICVERRRHTSLSPREAVEGDSTLPRGCCGTL